jgi:hypothetical protein
MDSDNAVASKPFLARSPTVVISRLQVLDREQQPPAAHDP